MAKGSPGNKSVLVYNEYQGNKFIGLVDLANPVCLIDNKPDLSPMEQSGIVESAFPLSLSLMASSELSRQLELISLGNFGVSDDVYDYVQELNMSDIATVPFTEDKTNFEANSEEMGFIHPITINSQTTQKPENNAPYTLNPILALES